MFNNIIIRRSETKGKTEGGIYIPEEYKEALARGTILAVGPGDKVKGKVEPLNVKEGDVVLFSEYAGTNINIDGEALLIMRETDILAIREAC